MANVRIKDITTTASTPATDDYIPIDGATNGSRKMLPKLDAMAAPDDTTTRDATTSLHGLMSKADKVKAEALTVGTSKTLGITESVVLNRQASTGLPVEFCIVCSDETTAITVGTGKATFRPRFNFTATAVYSDMKTAPTGSTAIFDINEDGASILGTKLSVDAGEKDSFSAASPATITDAAIAAHSEITVDFDQVGSTVAGAGVKVWILGYR